MLKARPEEREPVPTDWWKLCWKMSWRGRRAMSSSKTFSCCENSAADLPASGLSQGPRNCVNGGWVRIVSPSRAFARRAADPAPRRPRLHSHASRRQGPRRPATRAAGNSVGVGNCRQPSRSLRPCAALARSGSSLAFMPIRTCHTCPRPCHGRKAANDLAGFVVVGQGRAAVAMASQGRRGQGRAAVAIAAQRLGREEAGRS